MGDSYKVGHRPNIAGHQPWQYNHQQPIGVSAAQLMQKLTNQCSGSLRVFRQCYLILQNRTADGSINKQEVLSKSVEPFSLTFLVDVSGPAIDFVLFSKDT